MGCLGTGILESIEHGNQLVDCKVERLLSLSMLYQYVIELKPFGGVSVAWCLYGSGQHSASTNQS